jgi:hypothetical protein
VRSVPLKDGRIIQIGKEIGYSGQKEVWIDSIVPANGMYWSQDSQSVFEIKDSRLKMEYSIKNFESPDGTAFQVGYDRQNGIQKKCPVWIDGKPAPDGKYLTGLYSAIIVQDGRIK